MPHLNKSFVDSVRADSSGKDVSYFDDSLRGFGLRVRAGGAKTWIVMYRNREGRQRKLTIGRAGVLTPDEARKLARDKLADATKGADPASEKVAARQAMTVAQLCELYVREAEGRVKTSTLAMDRSRIDCHVVPLLGNRTAAGLTLRDIARFQADIAAGKTAKGRKGGRGGRTTGGQGVAARSVGMLGTILEFARRHGIIASNPARGVEKFPDRKAGRFLTFEDISTLGMIIREAEARGESRTGLAAIRALLLTGCRRMEMLALPWEWVDLKARCIRFGDTKSGAQLRPIGGAAVKYLSTIPRPDGCRWVFPADRGDGHFIGVPRVLARVCTLGGLDSITVHTLRHSFAAVAAELGFSELTIAGLLGHSVPGVTARYAHVPDSALIAAADRVSARIAAALDGVSEAEVVELHRQSA
jgi:integrase